MLLNTTQPMGIKTRLPVSIPQPCCSKHHRCTACCVIIWELAVLVHLNLTSCPNHKLYLLERLDQFRTRDGIEYDDLQAWSKTDGDALELVDW